jgi:hypothetical protein
VHIETVTAALSFVQTPDFTRTQYFVCEDGETFTVAAVAPDTGDVVVPELPVYH